MKKIYIQSEPKRFHFPDHLAGRKVVMKFVFIWYFCLGGSTNCKKTSFLACHQLEFSSRSHPSILWQIYHGKVLLRKAWSQTIQSAVISWNHCHQAFTFLRSSLYSPQDSRQSPLVEVLGRHWEPEQKSLGEVRTDGTGSTQALVPWPLFRKNANIPLLQPARGEVGEPFDLVWERRRGAAGIRDAGNRVTGIAAAQYRLLRALGATAEPMPGAPSITEVISSPSPGRGVAGRRGAGSGAPCPAAGGGTRAASAGKVPGAGRLRQGADGPAGRAGGRAQLSLRPRLLADGVRPGQAPSGTCSVETEERVCGLRGGALAGLKGRVAGGEGCVGAAGSGDSRGHPSPGEGRPDSARQTSCYPSLEIPRSFSPCSHISEFDDLHKFIT